MTAGRGPDACIEAVGMEAHGTGMQYKYDRAKQALHLHTDRGDALREAIMACRKGGTLSILGVYGVMDKFPLGAAFAKGLTLRLGQTHVPTYTGELLEYITSGRLNPSFVITHRLGLGEPPQIISGCAGDLVAGFTYFGSLVPMWTKSLLFSRQTYSIKSQPGRNLT